MTPLLAPDDVAAAARRIDGLVLCTPLEPGPVPGLWLKREDQQRSGAFKARGAAAALTALSPRLRAGGVVTHSSGNHGRALAEAAAALGCRATVVVPSNAAPHKVAAVRAAGAEVVVVPPEQRASRAAALAAEGLVPVPPFDHDDVICGQGTVGREILAQAGVAGLRVRRILAPVGGGGLVSGIAVAVAGSGVEVVAVEPECAGDLAESLALGRRVSWPVERTARTVADGLRLPSVGERPWQHIQALGVLAVTVSEHEIVAAMRVLHAAGVRAEPSGAVSLAGALRAAVTEQDGVDVAVVSGGNVGPDLPWDETTGRP
jgi:threonine dehydratase